MAGRRPEVLAYPKGARGQVDRRRGPQPRSRRPAGAGRRRVGYLAAGLIGAIVLLVGGAYLLLNSTTPASAGLGVSVPDEGRVHVDAGTPIQYLHYPPASGTHYPSPQPWGVYSTEVAEGYWVHNLEHGGIVLLYQCSGAECAALASQITAIYQRLPSSTWNEVKLVATPYGKLSAPFMLVAWDRQETLSTLDEASIAAFYRAYVDRGPEDAP